MMRVVRDRGTEESKQREKKVSGRTQSNMKKAEKGLIVVDGTR
jgi:hypothetical protein